VNDQLTIILTLKDRSAFTYRWMRYMNDIKCPYPILIADGGADDVIEAHLRQQHNYPDLHYTYIRYPFDSDYDAYYQKFADVVARVSTPYILLADNDDFYLLDAVPTFIRFLDDDGSFVSCGGNPITLHLLSSDNQTVGLPSAKCYVALANDKPKSVIADRGVDRLCYFLTNVERFYLWSTWYQIHRAAALRQGVSFVRKHKFTDPVAFEIHMHVCLLLTGKYKAFDAPLLVRQIGTSQTTSGINAVANLVERFIGANAFADIHRSLEWVEPALSEDDRTTIHKAMARWFADQVLQVYPVAQERSVGTATEGSTQRVYRLLRRLLRPLKRLVRRHTAAPPALRLPAIEKYILAVDELSLRDCGTTASPVSIEQQKVTPVVGCGSEKR
jgi:glycosyltransferase domain-containing protein